MTTPPRILVIAGSDSSGGAGIQADIKTTTMLGGYAMTAITCVTAQNTLGVTAVEVMPWDMVRQQVDACFNDIGVDAVKIGMIGSAETALLLADQLLMWTSASFGGAKIPIVFDPVMVATSGAVLADNATVLAFERLMKLATLTTPNVPELEALGGHEGMAARGVAYLAKGGDAEGAVLEDRLFQPGQGDVIWRSARIDTRHTHGTGCTLASAIATQLAKGLPLEAAIDDAREFVQAALLRSPGFGSGHGPMGHQAVRP
jgi:hydroxymethylpyrimidine/phosphomethylpyrimidine kinase